MHLTDSPKYIGTQAEGLMFPLSNVIERGRRVLV